MDLKERSFKETLVLKFQAKWCASCKVLTRVLRNIEHEQEIVEVDIDTPEGMDLAYIYNVKTLPTMIRIVDGKVKETINDSGYYTNDKLAKFLDGEVK
ncbi:hypothetical protein [Synechococcus phage BUCT-ZZ01]|nr:hypothetical protein [Synechococcus phage BUCT-ZZ01]